jgi:hypothetical protein
MTISTLFIHPPFIPLIDLSLSNARYSDGSNGGPCLRKSLWVGGKGSVED